MPLSIAWRSDKSDGMHFGLMVSASNHTSLITIRRASQTVNTSQRPEVLLVFLVCSAGATSSRDSLSTWNCCLSSWVSHIQQRATVICVGDST